MIPPDYSHDLILAIPLFVWTLFVNHFLARWVFDFAVRKGYPPESAVYFGRKIIHIFAAGLVALSVPFFFREPIIPFLSAVILALYTYVPHRKNRLFNWFQVKENLHEVNFCLMWGLCILIGWFFDKSFWLGVVPALFLSFGDGVTGIVRNIKYKKRTKAWEGSLAMLIVSLAIGWNLGLAGIVAAVAATLVERSDIIDDNISIPIVSLLVLILFQLCTR